MYKQFFHLSVSPFSIAPDPRFLYMSERHRDALAHLIYGVGTNGGFVLLTGEVGTGKTTISRALLEQVPQNANVALVLNPKVIAGELLATICDELQIPYPPGTTSIKVFVDSINDHLLSVNARGQKTVVIIEESQNLSMDVLEQLRLLTNLETHEYKLLQIVMIGQPELLEILNRPEMRQLSQRITARYHLMPMSEAETAAYINHRLSVAGSRDEVFPPASIHAVYQLTGGVPRRINLLCDRAMLGAYAQNKHEVDVRTVKKAAREVFGGAPSQVSGQAADKKTGGLAWLVVLLLLGLLGIGAFLYYKNVYAQTMHTSTACPADVEYCPKIDGNSMPATQRDV